jgi:hypothetical protein
MRLEVQTMIIRQMPAWPLQMRAETAAAYCDEAETAAFLRGVAEGHYPAPGSSFGGTAKWHRAALDAAIDQHHKMVTPAIASDLIDLL